MFIMSMVVCLSAMATWTCMQKSNGTREAAEFFDMFW